MKLDISEFEAFIQRRIAGHHELGEKYRSQGNKEKGDIFYYMASAMEYLLEDFQREYKRSAGTVVDDKGMNQVQEELSALLRGETPIADELNVGKDLYSQAFGIASMYALPLLVSLQKELVHLIEAGAALEVVEAALDSIFAKYPSKKPNAISALEATGWKRYQGEGGIFYVKVGQEFFLHNNQGTSIVQSGPAQVYVNRDSAVFIRDRKKD